MPEAEDHAEKSTPRGFAVPQNAASYETETTNIYAFLEMVVFACISYTSWRPASRIAAPTVVDETTGGFARVIRKHKLLDELEQSEGLLSERLPEAQFPALEASGTTTQPNSKCRGDVPHQNGDHSIAPPSSVIASTTTRLLTDPKKASSDGVTSGEAYLWDDAPSATPLHSERNAKNGMTHISTSAAETSTAQLQDRVDFPGAPTTTHVIGHDKPTVPVSDPNQSSCLRDFAERPGYSSRQLSSAVPPDDNALAETCGVSTLPAADSHESGGGANLYCRQKDQHDDGAQPWTTCGVPEHDPETWHGCRPTMDKFAVDLDKVLDELEQSEGLLSERLREAQFPALKASGPTTQPNSKCQRLREAQFPALKASRPTTQPNSKCRGNVPH
ncbi:hypothetical protein V5799_012786 [Amblyomma americanum]|uniref:Uncharacterized protein n=1 Tax=Amblyomma americanum TaxID=6943 RepID=A0AAQ4E7Z6_AMBAM